MTPSQMLLRFYTIDTSILNCPLRFIRETYSLAYRKFWNFHWNRTLKSKITESFWTDRFVVSFVNDFLYQTADYPNYTRL